MTDMRLGIVKDPHRSRAYLVDFEALGASCGRERVALDFEDGVECVNCQAGIVPGEPAWVEYEHGTALCDACAHPPAVIETYDYKQARGAKEESDAEAAV